jgi:glycosyltransferase involved in cell wall biosynthesis
MAADRVFDVPVGINESIWQPCAPRAPVGPCRIVFWGTFIPLHGVGIILEAIRILQSRQLDLEVTLIGDGQQGASLAEELANNPIACLRWRRELVGSATLLDEAMGAHILLGVFGESDKAGAVVPYKVQQALACNRPVISRDGPALGGVADPELGLIAIPPADPVALADTIEATWERLKGGWAVRSREIYDAHFSRAIIESRLAAALHRAARLDP